MSPEAEDWEQPERMLLPDLSTETTNTYLMPDGSMRLEASPTPINYQDAEGEWAPIDTSLVDAKGAAYDAKNAAGDHTTKIPADAGSTPVRVSQDGFWVTMKMRGMDGAPEIEGDTATYNEVKNADSVELQILTTGVKESIVLDSPPTVAAPVYTYEIAASAGVTAEAIPGVGVQFFDAAGEVRATIPVGTMVDSAVPAASRDTGDYRLTATVDGWTLRLAPDPSWLHDPERVYPVIVDPSIYVWQNRDCILKKKAPNQSFCGNGNERITVGRDNADTQFRALLDFNLTNTSWGPLPADAVLTRATLRLTLNGRETVGTGTYAIRTPSKLWGPGATWNSTGLGTQWGGNGGGNGGVPSSAAIPIGPVNRDVVIDLDVLNVVRPWVGNPAASKGFLLEPTVQQNTKAIFWPGTDSRHPVMFVDFHTVRMPAFDPQGTQVKCSSPGLNDGAAQVVVNNTNVEPMTFTVQLGSQTQVVGAQAGGSTGPITFAGLAPGNYTVTAHTAPSASVTITVPECPPYEPGPVVETFPRRAGQGLPAGQTDPDDPADDIDDAPGGAISAASSPASALMLDGVLTLPPIELGAEFPDDGLPAEVRASQNEEDGSSAAAGADATGDEVQVELASVTSHGRERAGAPTLEMGLTTVLDSSTEGENNDIDVRINYDTFDAGFGGGWSDRLQVEALPACYRTTPELPECQVSTPVPSVNDPVDQTLTFTAAPPLVDGEAPPAPPTQAGLDSCFATPSAVASAAAEDIETDTGIAAESADGFAADPDADDGDDIETDPDDELDVYDDNLNFDDGDAADEDLTTGTEPAAAPATNPATSVVEVPELEVDVSEASACRGLVYQVRAGAGSFAMASAEDDSTVAASTLEPSAQWQVGPGSGEFSWSYPIEVPAGMGSEAPSIALTYSSAAVDGRTGPESSQAGQVGQGWTLAPGHISRTYASCADDGAGANNGDLCWRTQDGHLVNDLSLVLAGRATKLIRDKNSGEFRLQDDPGWRVEYWQLGGPQWEDDASTPAPNNADGDNEAFRITSPSGVRYYFGYGTTSVWTVPVRGNNPGEPCHGNSLSSNACQQAWQWNLDRVVDADGNVVKYRYTSEKNHYRSVSDGELHRYDRAGQIAEITYAYARPSSGNGEGTHQAAIEFVSYNRCNASLRAGNTAAAATACTAANDQGPRQAPRLWPDVPTDLICDANDVNCSSRTPSFFSLKRYQKIITYRGKPGNWGPLGRAIDTYVLFQTMPDPDETGKGDNADLWLNAIRHLPTAAAGTTDTLPDVEFDGVALPNLVEPRTAEKDLEKYRVRVIRNELGGRVEVEYGQNRPCRPSHVENWKAWSSDRDCYTPRRAGDAPLVWYHKYLVTSVTMGDQALRLGNADKQTSLGTVRTYRYNYIGDPGWRFDGAALNTKLENRSWSDWRGYQTTRIRTMEVNKFNTNNRDAHPGVATNTAKSIRRVVVYRGMNKSRRNGAGDLWDAKVVTKEHPDGLPDRNPLRGRVAEETVLEPTAGSEATHATWLQRTYHGYRILRTANSELGQSARFVGESLTRSHTRVTRDGDSSDPGAARHWDRRHTVNTRFHDGGGNHRGVRLGAVIRVQDRGASTRSNPSGDKNVCTTTTWAANQDRWLRAPIDTMVTDDNCSSLRSRTVRFYDGSETISTGDGPDRDLVRGRLTRSDTFTQADHKITTRAEYDRYGRVRLSYDGLGRVTQTRYNADNPSATADDLPVTITEESPAGKMITTLEPRRALPVEVWDVDNGTRVKTGYDGYGRVVWVSKPKHAASGIRSVQFSYEVNNRRPSVIKTSTLRSGSTRDESWAYLDGWGRTVETQTADGEGALDDGRLVTATAYDELGQVWNSMPLIAATGAPGSGLVNADPDDVPATTRTEYDAAGRVVRVVQRTDSPQARVYSTSTLRQQGDRVISHPPVGGDTVTEVDGWGRTTRVRQLSGVAGESGVTTMHAASYSYDGTGNLTEISSDISGERTWSYEYDLAGRRVSTSDPDSGVTTAVFDDNSNQIASSNPTDGTVVTVYDDQDRPIQRFRDNGTQPGQQRPATCTAKSASDPVCTLLAEWTYDTAPGGWGQLASETSYNPYSQAGTYQREVTGYDANGNPLGVRQTVALDSSTSVTSSQQWEYNDADLVTRSSYDAVAGLPAMDVDTTYGVNGRVESVSTMGGSVMLFGASYDRAGRLVRGVSEVAGLQGRHLNREYEWENATGRLHEVGGSVFGRLTYAYDKVGNPTQITHDSLLLDGTSGGREAAWCYSYDPSGRLATAKTGLGVGVGCQLEQSRLDLIGVAQDLRYSYSEDRLAEVASTTPSAASVRYDYDGTGPHQVTGIATTSGTAGGSASTLPAPASLTYDGAGRVTLLQPASGATTRFSYNPTGSVSSSVTGHLVTANGYDAGGLRVTRRVSSVFARSWVVYLGDTEVTVTSGAVKGRRVFSGPGGALAVLEAGGSTGSGGPVWSFVLADGQGSVRFTRDQATGLDKRAAYLPFGEVVNTGSLPGERGYLGKPTDPDGQVRLDHRSYKPTLNVLTAPDPLLDTGDPQSLNPYAYARNNPVGMSDPNGLEPRPWHNEEYKGPRNPATETTMPSPPPSPSPTAVATSFDGRDACIMEPEPDEGGFPWNKVFSVAAGVAVGVGGGVGCTALTVGFGVVACVAGAGALGGATANAIDSDGDHSVGGYATSAAMGAVPLGVGRVAGPVVSGVGKTTRAGAANVAAKTPIGFAEGLGQTALTPGRLQHGTKNLTKAGVLPAWSGKTSPGIIERAFTPILEHPTATFDHTLGGTSVRGFLGEVNGQQVAAFIYKEGPYQGQLASSFVPSANQLKMWGVP